ncbi:hypothetical protein BDZ91DRAFT_853386 [Kalaharituber pfeilii]|nr:hypothetical protein BDZ91DRAFT_853386 [Kalaharituber pfeilii]
MSVIRKALFVILLLFLLTNHASCKPIADNSNSPGTTCVSPGLSCELSEHTCCAGYSCVPSQTSDDAYCAMARKPFIMASPGSITTQPRFMGRDLSSLENTNFQQQDCTPLGSPCDPTAPLACCLDSSCLQLEGNHYCVEERRKGIEKRDTNGADKCGNPSICSIDEHCCHDHRCQKHHPDTWLGTCVPVGYMQRREEEIVCQSYHDCPIGYQCSHRESGTWNGVCAAPEKQDGWLINRRDEEAIQKEEQSEEPERKKIVFPEYPTEWCVQEGCPCYYTSPCEMGICDNYDERMIGKCRKFRPGEGDNLQPGFPIDTLVCTYTGCPCNKWHDHCFNGACDGLNRAGYGKCRPFRPQEEPRNNRKINEACKDVGCACDRADYPCKNSRCVVVGKNKYGRCRRFDESEKMLYTRQEYDARCRGEGCPCRRQEDCLVGMCGGYNERGWAGVESVGGAGGEWRGGR